MKWTLIKHTHTHTHTSGISMKLDPKVVIFIPNRARPGAANKDRIGKGEQVSSLPTI